ncbi:MAG: hypothetical protein QMD03_09175 [Syntrophales bacterium]|nr:hypothetical protein [Syntrophales bacterium]
MGKAIKSRLSLQVFVFVLLLFPVMWCNPVPATAEGGAAGGEKYSFDVHGYVRTWASFNLHDIPDIDTITQQKDTYNDRYKCSMLRGSLKLDLDAKTGPFTWKVIGRGDQEVRTDYLTRLQEITQSGRNNFGSNNMQDSPGTEIMDQYNQGEFREYYVEFDPIQRVRLRLGRQQVVWGETDFFRAMDVIHGFDYQWRLFMEPENEELRKPLILANAMIQVPELGGSLQAIFRPGWDRPKWIGNSYPIEGGRWNPRPYEGFDVLGPVKYDYDYPDGDTDDATWGVRWSGIAGPVNYSFAYLRTLNNDPVWNSGINNFSFENQETKGLVGDLVYPRIDLAGLTVSGYVPWIDTVLSTEVVYTFDEPFNKGSGGDIDKITGSNVGPPLLGKAVANALGPQTPNLAAILAAPGDPDRTMFYGDGDAILGVVNRVLRPQGLTNAPLGNFVLPVLDGIYDGNTMGLVGALPASTGLQILGPVLSPALQTALPGLLALVPPAALQGNVGGLLAALEGVMPGASTMLLTDPGVQALLAQIGGLLQANPTRIVDIGRQNFYNAVYNFHYLAGGDPLLVCWVPGLHGVQKKDSLMVMLRADKNLAFTQRLLGTGKPAFFTVQAFNHVILDYHREEDIVRFITYGEHRKEIETMLTGVLVLHYRNEAIVPTLAAGWDVSYGGAFFFPSVEFIFGDHWRLRLEADFFFPSGAKDPATINDSWLDLRLLGASSNQPGGKFALGNAGVNENSTSFLGYFNNQDQFLIRLTYQF